jgi:hypothetical protein
MKENPYTSLPDKAFWRRGVASVAPDDVDPVGDFNLAIDPQTKVATAGSCFAQHIARHLRAAGYNHYVTEPGHPLLPDEVRQQYGYGLFSCRFGNIYTTRQLLQLFERAHGRFAPNEPAWFEAEDIVLDPFRPTVQPGGFISEAEMLHDRAQHLRAVKRMFETLDVFIFTLGLTECWRSTEDGAVFPLCPGVQGGQFDPERHEFYNQPVEDVIADLREFCFSLRKVNPQAEIILTVSPVPLIATAQSGEHVLSATTYSKSALRVAADVVRREFENVHYFPSFEIVTGQFNRGTYYAPDLRNVTEAGVEHVMRVFMKHATSATDGTTSQLRSADRISTYLETSQRINDVECDEVLLDRR